MHTKGPWKSVEGWAYSHDGTQYNVMRIVDKDNTDVLAKIKDREANAEFIVRACNSHDDLLEALEFALVSVQWMSDAVEVDPDKRLEIVTKAIQKAKA